ncbi:MAG TPA: GNAT family N-acetyltransferase [Thermoanaerobaculia bacterium]|nr:GNAT family N-acetyltransferase [Thermoanaerobaculia bacterium]
MIELREAGPSDADAIRALRDRCFPDDDPEKFFPRGPAFVAADDARIVAHLALLEQKYVIRGIRTPAFLAVDAMTDPDYRGRGLFTRVAAFTRDHLGGRLSVAWQIRKVVLPAMMRTGWMPRLRAPVLIRPLVFGKPDSSVRVISPQSTFDFFAKSEAYEERTPAWMRERYRNCEVLGNDDAFLATRRVPLRGIDTLAIVDIAWRDVRAARAVLRHALACARTRLAATLVTTAHPAFGFFLRHGFVPGPHWFRFLVNGSVDARWALSWADTDHV